MINNVNIGKPIIDELRLCYIGEPTLLVELASVDMGNSININTYTLHRCNSVQYEYYFSVYGTINDDEIVDVGDIKFGKYGSYLNPHYVYYKIANRNLYSEHLLRYAMNFPVLAGMRLNNITAMDIAIDYQKNVSRIIKKLLRDENITTILNGKTIKERNKTIAGIVFDYSTSLNRLKCPTITVRQAKAIKNKSKGITIQSYDKKAEITNSSNKNYILDYYGHPKYLFRLEVRLQYQEIKDYMKSNSLNLSEAIVFNTNFLKSIYYYHLSSVLRFRKGRKVLQWEDIINCSGKV